MSIKEIVILAIALDLDVFFAALMLGTRLRYSKEIGFANLLMTSVQCIIIIIGLLIGSFVGIEFGESGSDVGAVVLILIGYEMVRSTIKCPNTRYSQKNLVLMLIGASLEEIVTGITLGASGIPIILFLIIFIAVTYFVNLLGLNLGYTTRRYVNLPIDFVTGIILMVIGFLSLLHFI